MDMDDFGIMLKGFFDKRKRDELSFARVAFYIAAIHQNIAGKAIYMSKFLGEWFGEKETKLSKDELKERSKEMMKRVRLKAQILEEKTKNVKKPVKKKLGKRT